MQLTITEYAKKMSHKKTVKPSKQNFPLNWHNLRFLENAPISVMVLDKNGTITFINKSFNRLSRIKSPIGKQIREMAFFKKEGLFNEYQKVLKYGKIFKKEHCHSRFPTKQKYIDITAVPLIGKNGEIKGAISMAIDSTESVMAKLRLGRMNAELEKRVIERTKELYESNKKYKKSIAAKLQFIADASHELKTPLAIMKLSLELEAKKMKEKKIKTPSFFSVVNNEIDKMNEVMTDLIFIGIIDGGEEKIQFNDVDLINLIKNSIQRLQNLAKEKNIKLSFENGKENLFIKGDKDKLEKLFVNIIKNAIKYGHKNGWVKIKIKKSLKGDSIKIDISDNGIGIPNAEIPYIFDRFYRSSVSKNSGESGFGLGLAICKWIVQKHRGYITVNSKLGKGTHFKIILPTSA